MFNVGRSSSICAYTWVFIAKIQLCDPMGSKMIQDNPFGFNIMNEVAYRWLKIAKVQLCDSWVSTVTLDHPFGFNIMKKKEISIGV